MTGRYEPYLDEIFAGFESFAEQYPDEFRFNDFIRHLIDPKNGYQKACVELLYEARNRPGGPVDGAHQAIGTRLKTVASRYGYTNVSRGPDITLWGSETPDSSIYQQP